MGKYLARGHGVRTGVRTVFYHMTNLETNLLKVLTREAARFCSRAARLFPAPLAQMRTALIRDFHHQWFCKERARRAVRVISDKCLLLPGVNHIRFSRF